MMLWKNDFTKAAGSLQVSAGQDAGAKAAIHAMSKIFANVDMNAVLLIDAENAFNSKNHKVMKLICPIIATYIINSLHQNMKFSITNFFSKCVTFTDKIRNVKFYFLCSDCYATPSSRLFIVSAILLIRSEDTEH